MKLVSLSAKNFRLLENVTLQFDPEVSVVVGPNNVGKSNIFDALLLLRTATSTDVINAALAWGGYDKLVSRQRLHESIRVGASFSPSPDISCSLEFDQQGIIREDASTEHKRGYVALRQGGVLVGNDGTRRQSQTPFLHGMSHFVELVSFFRGIRNIEAFRSIEHQYLVAPSGNLQPRGQNLSQVLHHFYNDDRERFDSYEALVRQVLPEVDIIETPLVGSNASTVRIRFTDAAEKFDLAVLSSGVKDLLVLIAAAHFSPKGCLVLVEEPENHLHPGAQKALCTVFRSLAKEQDKQFILLTQSETILSQFIGARCTFMQRGETGGTQAVALTGGEITTAWTKLGIDDDRLLQVLARNRQVLIITEGRRDNQVLRALWQEDPFFGSILITRSDGGGFEEIIKTAAKLRDAFQRFRLATAVFLLLDSDGMREEKLQALAANGFEEKTSHVWKEKELESYLLLPNALASVCKKSMSEVQALLSEATGSGKERFEWILNRLGVPDLAPSVIVTNARRGSPDELPQEFEEVRLKIAKLLA